MGRQKGQEWKPEYSLEQIELVCKDKDAWGPLFNKTSRPRDDDETVESLWSDWDIPRRMMQVALWIKEKNEETGEWESTFGRCSRSRSAMIGASRGTLSEYFVQSDCRELQSIESLVFSDAHVRAGVVM